MPFPDRWHELTSNLESLRTEITGVTHRDYGDIPGCIMLPIETPERSLREMAADTSSFHCRVQAYLQGKIGYERVW